MDGMIHYDFNFKYENSLQPALQNVKGSIGRGSCTVLCGSSGCGKSTFLRCINKLIPDFYEGDLSGCCYIDGKNAAELSIGQVGRMAASVFQDPRSQFYTTNSSAEVAFALENYGYSHEEIVQRVEEAYKKIGLQKLQGRNVFELSSGEKQLVAILSACALNNEVFLLDEPTANLDAAAIQQLAVLLKNLKDQGKTIIINEHRLYYLRDIADQYLLMDHGVVVNCYDRNEMLQMTNEELRKRKLRTVNWDQVQYEGQEALTLCEKTELEMKQLGFSYKKKSDLILQDVSASFQAGEIVGLIGSNGSGKTTLGKLCAGLEKPQQGKIILNGETVTAKTLKKNSIFIMQEAEFQFFTNSVTNELLYGRKKTPELVAEIEEKLQLFGLWEQRNSHPFSLSGGQMQKLTILIAYFSPKPIVILDEPTAGLDRASLDCCTELIRQMQQTKLILIITHDLELIASCCTRVLQLKEGYISNRFELCRKGSWEQMKKAMEEDFRISDNARPIVQKMVRPRCDLRIKFLFLLMALLATVFTDQSIITAVFASCLILTLYEHRFGTAALGGIFYGGIYLLYFLFPQSIMGFVVHYFPRFIPIWLSMAAITEGGDSARFAAALRYFHCPEKIIMVNTVILRFFPVLTKDMAMMRQSIATRSFFPSVRDKLAGVGQYFELIVVPMIFRVIRIAEALSASAETRGIALSGKRQSFIALQLKKQDIFLTVILAVFTAVGIIL